MNPKKLTEERGKTHGDFSDNARVSQLLKAVINSENSPMNDEQREAIDMICLKLSRIASGQADYRDHWDDIAGYAHLAAESCEK